MALEVSAPRGPGRPKDAERTERRQREILDVATHVFANSGYAATDVQVVADELNVGKGTVYRYFPTKEQLFLAAVDQGMQKLTQTVDAAAEKAEAPIERIECAIRAYLKFFDRHSDILELVIQERAYFRNRKQPTYFAYRDANIERWKELLRELIQAGVVRDVPVERLTDVISDLLYGTIFTNHFAGRRKSLASQCEDVLDVAFHGMLVPRKRGKHV